MSQKLSSEKSSLTTCHKISNAPTRAKPLVCLAPMDGITDTAYRQLVRSLYQDVVLFSEFTSADGFLRSEKVRQRLQFVPQEHPYFVQLFGGNPASFAEAARILAEQGVAGVDINMGCPARRIVNSQHGSGLMRDPLRACQIVEAVAKTTGLAVSVKTRLGWHSADGLLTFARDLVNAGASLLTIHGRTYNQGFKGQANWQPIYDLKHNLNVTILGNGDLKNRGQGIQQLGPLDGFMIGRAAIGNPWVFASSQTVPTMAERIRVVKLHFQLLRSIKSNERHTVLEFRKHLVGYIKGFPLAKEARVSLLKKESKASLMEALDGLLLGMADKTYSDVSPLAPEDTTKTLAKTLAKTPAKTPTTVCHNNLPSASLTEMNLPN